VVETKNVTDSAVSGEYPETAAGKTHSFSLRSVRYVRDWVNGSTSNVGNHWVEIQVWGQRSVTYIGNYLEWTGATDTMKTYYYAGATRAAMREGSSLYYLLGDHLGSTSLVTDPGGVILSAARYDPWGELRVVSGPSQTRYGYTGQRAEKGLGLYFYGARFYDPQLSRFLSADSIIPQQQGVQAWDRYAYVNNNSLRYVDPSGHAMTQCGLDGQDCGANAAQVAYETQRYNYENYYIPEFVHQRHLDLVEISTFAQDVAFGASSAGAGFETVGLLIGGPAGFVAGNGLHQVATNPVETVASIISTGASVLDDIAFTPGSGSYINDDGVVVISDATATSVALTAVGSVIPIATVDVVIDGYASRFNHGQAPGILELFGWNGTTIFGLIQLGE